MSNYRQWVVLRPRSQPATLCEYGGVDDVYVDRATGAYEDLKWLAYLLNHEFELKEDSDA